LEGRIGRAKDEGVLDMRSVVSIYGRVLLSQCVKIVRVVGKV
jgi:hypothetical protein